MNSSVKIESRPGVQFDIFVAEHTKLKQGDQIVVHVARKTACCARRHGGCIYCVRSEVGDESSEWAAGNRHRGMGSHLRRSCSVNHYLVGREAVTFRGQLGR